MLPFYHLTLVVLSFLYANNPLSPSRSRPGKVNSVKHRSSLGYELNGSEGIQCSRGIYNTVCCFTI